MNSTARNPQASDTADQCDAVRQQDGTLSNPLFPTTAPGSRIAEAGLIETLEEYSRGECLTGQYIQEVNV